MEQQHDSTRRRVKQIFKYLQALNELRNPVTRNVNDYGWLLWLRNLPKHESVDSSYEPASPKSRSELLNGTFSLTVNRPKLSQVPPPPEAIKDWLAPGWEHIDGEVKVQGTRTAQGTTDTEDIVSGDTASKAVKFESNPERVRLLQAWSNERDAWIAEERPARSANKLFERLYDLYSTLEREAERFELVLGNGILNQRLPNGGVHHPILLKRINLAFDPKKPAFTITETDDDVELYSALFMNIPGADAAMIRQRKGELEQGQFHPLGAGETTGFFKSIVNSLGSKGKFIEKGPLSGEQDQPRLGNDPVIFTRNRSLGFAAGLDNILQRLDSDDAIPGSLINIAGSGTSANAEDETKSLPTQISEGEVLLTKPANSEQIKIAQQLSSHGAVIVQGPPGTGKTHTIANLIGHLLAHGKRVLVTSHTSKALSRVRDQLVEPLQSLCVSVLGQDAKSRDELKRSIDSIASKIASTNAEGLEKQASQLEERRNHLLQQLANLQKKLLEARTSEYADIVINGTGYPPAEAARKVKEAREIHGWMPTPVTASLPCPLSWKEVQSLYQTNVTLNKNLETELDAGLPDPQMLPAPEALEKWLSHLKQLQHSQIAEGAVYWTQKDNVTAQVLMKLGQAIHQALAIVRTREAWKLELLDASRAGGGRDKPWKKLVVLITETNEAANAIEDQFITHAPRLSSAIPLHDQHRILSDIVAYLKEKGKLGKAKLLLQREWSALIKDIHVEHGAPQSLEEFRALSNFAALSLKRQQLISRWDRMVSQRGGLSTDQLGDRPERTLAQQANDIQHAIKWYHKIWQPRLNALVKAGFNWNAWTAATPLPINEFAELQRLQFASTKLGGLIKAEIGRIYSQEIEAKLGTVEEYLETSAKQSSSIILKNLISILKARDAGTYSQWHKQLLGAVKYRALLDKRRTLLAKLSKAAPQWAHAIEHRTAPHNSNEAPGNVDSAWLWRQLTDELDRRSSLSMDTLQRKIENTTNELREITGALVDRRAWATQVRRLQDDQEKRQALIGWLDIMRKIGAGTGKRVPLLRREAKKLMKKCKTAVPVWVMPLTGVVENFDPRDTRFDVVIIDEASQVDVMGLVALYMAKSVVVVGDHEQVSPSAVGVEVDRVQHLIEEYLQGIPNAVLYDGRTSVYDLARQAFGGVIGLREHFRCVPDIIQFSNALSYDFTIRPLRDASHVQITPHVVAHRVNHASYEKHINTEEAQEVAALLIAASEQPEYNGKTYGVVTLVGDKQAEVIEKLLRKHLTPVQYEQELRILCGNPAQFQGDERDVMFLSVVHASTGVPLRIVTADMYKQRFNVAASRARDQMWVVHSLDPKADLKEGDLRKRLIEHAMDPGALTKEVKSGEHQVESEFERLVLRRLVAKGYHVIPQWKVGAFRIDLVVEGPDGQKLAVECDGDRYHPQEKLAEDMARQAILERLGWTFARIRGSLFFRDPDAAMQPVFERLNNLDIQPNSAYSTGEVPVADNELLERIRGRSAELQAQWKTEKPEGNMRFPRDKNHADALSISITSSGQNSPLKSISRN